MRNILVRFDDLILNLRFLTISYGTITEFIRKKKIKKNQKSKISQTSSEVRRPGVHDSYKVPERKMFVCPRGTKAALGVFEMSLF